MDVWTAISIHNTEKVGTVLEEFGSRSPELTKELFLEESRIVRMGVLPLWIGVSKTISGVEFDDCYMPSESLTQ